MRYLLIETPRGASEVPWWISALSKILPSGSPDLEPLWAKASYWWLEVDAAGRPQREIGFSSEGEPLVLGPVGDNIGFLIDSSDDWSGTAGDSVDAAQQFERIWDDTWPRFQHLESDDLSF
jgi:hypothetical protein